MAITLTSVRDMDLTAPLFVPLRAAYPDFLEWASRVGREPEEERPAFVASAAGGKLEGCALLKLVDDAPEAAKLSTFRVLPEAEGRGIGSALLEAASKASEEAGALYVVVDFYPEGQKRLRGFLERRGWVMASRLPSGEVRYSRPLSPPLPAVRARLLKVGGSPMLLARYAQLLLAEAEQEVSTTVRLFREERTQIEGVLADVARAESQALRAPHIPLPDHVLRGARALARERHGVSWLELPAQGPHPSQESLLSEMRTKLTIGRTS